MVKIGYVHSISKHPDHEKLQIVSLTGLAGQFVVMQGTVKLHEQVIAFMDGAVIPLAIQELAGVVGLLKGPVHTYKARGVYSHGFLIPFSTLAAYYPISQVGEENLAEVLGVTYQGTIYPDWAYKHTLEGTTPAYEILDARPYMNVVSELLYEPVFVTEKVHGMHWYLRINRYLEYMVGSRWVEYEKDPEHPFYQMLHGTRGSNILFAAFEMMQKAREEGIDQLVLRGEFCGSTVLMHDVEFDGQNVGAKAAWALFNAFSIQTVPLLTYPDQTLKEWLGAQDIISAADGKSRVGDGQREGIVIRPAQEMSHPLIGRLILKVTSPAWSSSLK